MNEATQSDTIVAPTTASGPSGVAVVRLSGPEAVAITARLARLPEHRLKQATMRLRWLRDERGQAIDRGYVVVFRGPRSFTGEDVAELQVHGSTAVIRRLMDAAVSAGARPAEAGEFSLRAFRNGRLDLVQAEALADLVGARSEAARELALAQLDGRLSALLAELREPLLTALAEVESRLDFAEEEEVDELDRDVVIRSLASLVQQMETLAATARAGRLRMSGIRVALAGAPNAGKSTLFNALVGDDRALVHAEPGTTRDVIEVPGELAGLQLSWLDTAGLRQDAGEVEAAGVARAKAVVASADMVLWLVDGSAADPGLPRPEARHVIPVRTKSDLLGAGWWRNHPVFGAAIAVSAPAGDGLEALRAAIVAALSDISHGQLSATNAVLTRERHAAGLKVAVESLGQAMQTLAGELPLELAAADLRDAADVLARLTGEIAPEHVLEAIFSRFCIGK